MIVSYFVLVILLALSVPLTICILKAPAYADYVNALNKNDFSGCKYFGLGFVLIDLLKIDFKSGSVHKAREQAGVLFGRKYADFYVRVLYAQALTYTAIMLYIMLFLACLVGGAEGLLFVVLGIVSAVVIYKYYLKSYDGKIEKLNEIYMRDFPNAVSTIALLVNGGMFLRDAWKEVAYSDDAPLNMQMRTVVDDMNNGISEADAIFAFANRCSTKEIRKFATLITQAIEKGGRDLTDSLMKQADMLINEKKQLVLQQGEKASNKLMMPIAMIFIGVLVIVMVPIISNMGM